MLQLNFLKIKKPFLWVIILANIVTMLVFEAICFPLQACAAVQSIKYGWVALDKYGNPVLQGMQYDLSKNVNPISFISNGFDRKPVTKGSVVYLANNKPGTAQALIIGDYIPGCKDAFITSFSLFNSLKAISHKILTASVIIPCPQYFLPNQ